MRQSCFETSAKPQLYSRGTCRAEWVPKFMCGPATLSSKHYTGIWSWRTLWWMVTMISVGAKTQVRHYLRSHRVPPPSFTQESSHDFLLNVPQMFYNIWGTLVFQSVVNVQVTTCTQECIMPIILWNNYISHSHFWSVFIHCNLLF